MAFAPTLLQNTGHLHVGNLAGRSRRRSSPVLVAMVLALAGGSLWWYSFSHHNVVPGSDPAVPNRADIVFVLDATGSMSGEIEDVKSSLMAIGNRLANRKPQPDVRFGAVFYRDLHDKEITKAVPLSKDHASVREAIMDVQATGGGDRPEHVGIGLHKALEMDWSHSEDGGVRLIYLVGDAPPQNYDDGYDVDSALQLAKQLGVKIHVIGCSGLGQDAESMRRIADISGGTFSDFERHPNRQRHDDRRRYSTARTYAEHGSGFGAGVIAGSDRKSVGPIIGIDLGTTYSAVGIYKNGRAEIIPNEKGNRITPSYVAYVGDHVLVGEEALVYHNHSGAIFDVKRLIGQRYHSSGVQHDIAMLPYRVEERAGKPVIVSQRNETTVERQPEEVAAVILRNMKEMSERYLGREVRDAVVTVPAHFSDSQRQATKDAGAIAGLSVLRIINEPTAAAIAYGLDKKNEHNIIVYDLGGGTLDVSLLTIDNGVFEVVATSGRSHLGGRDFDDRVIQHLIHVFREQHGLEIAGDRALWKLRRAATSAKHALSSQPTTTIEIENLFDGIDFKTMLTRARFEELNKNLFNETLSSIERVLEDSGLKTEQIDEIVLSGGSTRIPKIHQLVKSFFAGKEPSRGINPDEAVAYGAAVQGGLLSGEGGSDLLLLDVTPLSLGFATSRGEMISLVPRNTVIPTKRSHMVSTAYDDQPAITIQVFEGERLMSMDNHLLAEFSVGGLPPAPAGQPQIEVTFEIDSKGILHVGAEDKNTGKSEKITITNDKNRLSEYQIEAMIKDAEAYSDHDVELAKRLKSNSTNETCGEKCIPRAGNVPITLLRETAGISACEEEEGMGRLSAMMLHSISDEL